MFNFLRLLPIADTIKCRSPKNGKIWGFSPTEGDRINRSRRNLARKRTASAVAHQIWPSSVKGGGVLEPRKVNQMCQNCGFGHRKPTHLTHLHEIWRVSVDLGCAIAHQIWPSSIKGDRYGTPKIQNLPKIVVFGHRKPTQ